MAGESLKAYWRREFSRDALSLEHHNRKDFYLSRWQQGTSALPMLALRGAELVVMVTIWLGSFLDSAVHATHWFIYFTHWGLTLQLVTAAAGVGLSAHAFWTKLPDASLGVARREKCYWVLYNASVTIAFLITVFYWTVVYTTPDESMEDYEPRLLLDVSTHGLTSLLALAELLTGALPSRALHLPHPAAVAAAYALFSVVYYLAGGHNESGDPWVYEALDWARPGAATLAVLLAGLLLLALHALVVGLSVGRDALARRLVPDHSRPDASRGNSHSWRQRSTAAV